jgi:fructose-1,6-bisphosphatase/inositol monophosphatase family enzyme
VDDFGLAEELVRDAGALASRMLRDGLETHYKTSVSDVVSAADHAAEELVVSRLRSDRPDDGVVGEEGSMSPGNGRTWYVDPVDGTYNFLSGLPYWCSAIGLADADGPVLGAVYHPALDELWVGGRDRPTTLNGVPVEPLVDRPLAAVSIASYLNPRYIGDTDRVAAWQAVVARSATLRILGSASVDLAGVASGRLGLFLQANLRGWDWVPGSALVLGAGGAADTLRNGTITWQVAGNRAAVREALSVLG